MVMSRQVDLTLDEQARRGTDWKLGARALGISESFQREDERSIVVGVVMRGDLKIDGAAFCHPRVGGLDATSEILSMYSRLGRSDVRAIIIGGTVISWFNIVDLEILHRQTGLPVVSVSYEESKGIKRYLEEYFPADWETRYEILVRNGDRSRVTLENGFDVFVNTRGITVRDAKKLLNVFTHQGKAPEPVRVAGVIAASLRRDSAEELGLS
ncbi:DUF99 family protein [Candidatus Thorarchaeota archaeon]|nr:MAG: DUF99 family protein [Candidatus Thorarchaeota archaeon]